MLDSAIQCRISPEGILILLRCRRKGKIKRLLYETHRCDGGMNLAKRDRFLFTSESVTEGHPDKIADQISDAILDACLAEDPFSRVACETLTCTGLVVIAGEITTKAYVDFQSLVRGVVASIGYDNAVYGFDSNTCAVISSINKQSGDI